MLSCAVSLYAINIKDLIEEGMKNTDESIDKFLVDLKAAKEKQDEKTKNELQGNQRQLSKECDIKAKL